MPALCYGANIMEINIVDIGCGDILSDAGSLTSQLVASISSEISHVHTHVLSKLIFITNWLLSFLRRQSSWFISFCCGFIVGISLKIPSVCALTWCECFRVDSPGRQMYDKGNAGRSAINTADINTLGLLKVGTPLWRGHISFFGYTVHGCWDS